MSTSRRMFDESQIKAIANNPITDIDLAVGDITVDYNTTDGMSINSISKITHQDGSSESPMINMEIPIVPGEHINIDKADDKEQIVVKAVNVCPEDLSKLPNPTLAAKNGYIAVWMSEQSDLYLAKYLVTNNIAGDAIVRRVNSGHIRVADNPTQNYFAVNKGYVDNKLSTSFKTLFGNQSIYGSGNIDIYKHDIIMTKSNGKAYLTLYSSSNTIVDSLNDLKAITKNDKFTISCTGYIGSKTIVAITELNLILNDGTTELLTNTTFTDTVTTI